MPAQQIEQKPIVTPAVARSISRDTEVAQSAQTAQRARLYGITSTYNRFKGADQNNGAQKLG